MRMEGSVDGVTPGDGVTPEVDFRVELAEVSVAVAQAVAAHLVDERPLRLDQSTKSSATDVVTQMDSAGEEMAKRMLAQRRPGDGFLGEEGTAESSSTGLVWVVDPIDGTTNYLYRHPAWAVSVAVMEEGRTIAGCVCAPLLGMTAHAHRGGGAWFRQGGSERRLSVSSESVLSRSLIATGFGYTQQRRVSQGRLLARVIAHVRDIRRCGAASIDLCWVASGQLDGYYESGLHLWDFAAGALIVEEAGGIVTTVPGESVWSAHDGTGDRSAPTATIVAAGRGIHSDLVGVLRQAEDEVVFG